MNCNNHLASTAANMSTTFAITGYRRHSLKHYRPSYYSELAPIYEDVPVQPLPAKSSRKFNLLSDLSGYSQEIKVYCSKNDSYHNYATVDVNGMDGKVANPSPVSASMMDGLMKSRFQKKSSKREINETFPDIGQNFTKRNTDENMNRYVNKSVAYDVNVELGLKEDAIDRPENDTITLERTSSLYQSPFTTNSSLDYAVVTNDRGVAVKRWPKLEPEPPRDKTLCGSV
ncbi:hypothetical protein MAR_008564 [Mya arenaria]|uniref:Uncharacterized protein n=1 Tax=Mya arenaria TaxID=6604 RepID=A0ABY7E4D2_MYAAR|nr:hypothetical protein MAR_008564 [Mya arenaria]